jgi:peptidoglycan/xylan/chitin deacetylase (PgdA/CDA1 family)
LSSRAKVATFLYHDVCDDPRECGFQRRAAMPYKQTRAVFVQHLQQMAAAGTPPKPVWDLDVASPGKNVLITFDDGGKGALCAAEELNRFGWKGHFFVTTGLIGTRTFLNADEIRYLHSCGHVIGSHSDTHPDIFRALPFEQMVGEWRTSCAKLADILGSPCLSASVPGGDVSKLVFRSADNAGLRYLFTSDPVLMPTKYGDCWVLGRVCPKADEPLANIRRLAEFSGWAGELARVRVKTTLKIVFSPLYRTYVRYATQQH